MGLLVIRYAKHLRLFVISEAHMEEFIPKSGSFETEVFSFLFFFFFSTSGF